MCTFNLASDLHLEFYPKNPQLPLGVRDRVLVLAGDINTISGDPEGYKRSLEVLSDPFALTLYVPGNHEYYDKHLKHTMDELDGILENVCSRIPNLVLLQKKSVIVNETLFSGCTMWTNIENGVMGGPAKMNDYNMVCGTVSRGVPVTVDEIRKKHQEHASWLRSELEDSKRENRHLKSVVVVTHHAPDIALASGAPVAVKFPELVPWYYSTDLRDILDDSYINFWCHGHTHESYVVKNRPYDRPTILTNARGYTTESTGYTPEAFVRCW